jgi:hypothetical protein
MPNLFKKLFPGTGQEPKQGEFILAQLPDDFHVSVDSHSASPAFSEDAKRLATELMNHGALSVPDYIRLMQPQNADTLIAAAERRDEAQAKLLQEHPELLGKGGSKKR